MCVICGFDPCTCSCPNYIPPKSVHHCIICNEGIIEGEKYIENLAGECVHFDCVPGLRWLLSWLGNEIKEEVNYESYRD